MFQTLQLIALFIGFMAFGFFAKANFAVVKFRKLTKWGLLQLWMGNLQTQTLVKHATVANNLVEKKLLKAIILHNRTKLIVYASILGNAIILALTFYSK